METYARSLIPALNRARPTVELVAFVNREALDDLSAAFRGQVRVVDMATKGRSRSRRVAAEQLRLPRLLRRHGVDLLHSLGATTQVRPSVASVVTLYDVIYARHPETHTLAMRAGMRVLVPLSARSADRIIAISENAANEIALVTGADRERIDVVYPGGRVPGSATPEPELRSRLSLGAAPIVLSVSARRPHKNLVRLLRAFAGVRAQPAPVLVLPGYPTGFEDELEREVSQLEIGDRVVLLGWVSDADLEGLYRACACFVFPSLAEGFGLPVLEAMERGVAVACSNVSAMPEVAGDAARYFDPLDVDDIRAAILDLLGDPALAARLGAAGRARAREFSWERAAKETFAVYERAFRAARARRAASA
jgi:glycosyltransferase involved in cell wall biosynthesis